MRSYDGARALFSFLSFLAWSMVIVGVMLAFGGSAAVSQFSRSSSAIFAALPGIGVGAIGLFLIALVQNARATVDTAEYTQQMLKVARDQLEVSKQSLKQNQTAPQSYEAVKGSGTGDSLSKAAFADSNATAPRSSIQPNIKALTYDDITRRNGLYFVGNIEFRELEYAREYVERSQPSELDPSAITESQNSNDKLQHVNSVGDVIVHDGENIKIVEAGYVFGGTVFGTLELAMNHIDRTSNGETSPLIGGVTR